MSKILFSVCLILIASSLASASKLEESQNLRRLSDLGGSWFTWTNRAMKLSYYNQSNQYHVVTNLPNTPNANMMLSLYSTDNVVIGASTLGFSRYRNSNNNMNFNYVTAVNPYMEPSGTPSNIAIQVPCTDGAIVNVGSSTVQTTTYGTGNNAILTDGTISTKNIQNLGKNSYGYLSMSVPSMKANNIGDTFSIYLDKIDRTGLVILGKDLSYSRDIFYTASWKTNGSWSTQGTIQTKVGSTDLGSNSYNLIFDINQNITGVPQTLFDSIKTNLAQYGVTGCTQDLVQPVCSFAGRLWDLPTIYLKNVGGANTWFSQNIAIPPKVYVAGQKKFGGIITEITLNFMALTTSSNSRNGFSYNSPYSASNNPGYVIAAHNNDIIIDSSIMAHYYTLFEANSDGTGTVTMYVASGTSSWWFYWNWPRWCKVIFIVVVVVLVLVCLLGGAYSAKRRRLQQEAAAN